MDKTAKPPMFMPAPRPTARTSADEAKRLLNSTADLGFRRSSTEQPEVGFQVTAKSDAAPTDAPVEPVSALAPPRPTEHAVKAKPTANKTGKTDPRSPKPKLSQRRAGDTASSDLVNVTGQTLRFDVPDSVWVSLKLASVHRRVTVKYLILEALQQAGYEVDLESIPEDGRRLR